MLAVVYYMSAATMYLLAKFFEAMIEVVAAPQSKGTYMQTLIGSPHHLFKAANRQQIGQLLVKSLLFGLFVLSIADQMMVDPGVIVTPLIMFIVGLAVIRESPKLLTPLAGRIKELISPPFQKQKVTQS